MSEQSEAQTRQNGGPGPAHRVFVPVDLRRFGGQRNGLSSYENRLGADIVVVPYEATTKKEFESILVQGIPGTFYMDGQYYEKIASIEGVQTAAPQFYLASTSSGCCSVAVQLIGFDPELDFTVQPWVRDSYGQALGDGDIIIGSDLTLPTDGMLQFYNTPCRVVGQLDKTGTGLDTAVYANMTTIRTMMQNAEALGFHYFDNADPASAVSSVLIRVADGYDAAAVTADINVHVRHVEAAQTTNMLTGIASGLSSVSRVIGILTGMIWVLALVILVGYPELFLFSMPAMMRIVLMVLTLIPLAVVSMMGIDGDSLFQYLGHIIRFFINRRRLHFRRIGYHYDPARLKNPKKGKAKKQRRAA